MKHLLTRFAAILTLAFGAAASCAAGTITSQAISQDLQVANLELTDLGFDPSGFFFFTGNTAYDFNGTYEVEIIASALNPAGATSLDGYNTSQVTLDIDSLGNVTSMTGASSAANVPEPSETLLFPGGMGLIFCLRRKRPRFFL